MERSSPYALSRLVRGIKKLARGQLKCLEVVRTIVSGKSGLEIGGPSPGFRRYFELPIYDSIQALDNCDFAQTNKWASHNDVYCFSKRRPCGRSYFVDGTKLSEISNARYDFLLSSHNLEHIANPIKALREWQRVVKPGGHLVMILPYYAHTFDHRRVPTTVAHMLEDFEQNVGEDDLTHVEETVTACSGMWGTEEEHRRSLRANFSHRMMHHHVFDEANSKALLETAGYTVLAAEMQNSQLYLVATTPSL